MARSVYLLFLFLVAALTGCNDEAQFGATPEAHVQELHDGFEYRWGDAPFAVAAKATDWTSQAFPGWPAGGNGRHNLWQRLKVPALASDDQVLMFGAWMIFEVYRDDGTQLYHFGNFDAEGKGWFPGRAWHWVRLRQADAGHYLYFRFHSDDSYVGLYQGVRLGTAGDHVIWMFKRDIALIVMGAVYLFMGLVTIFMFTRNRQEKINVSFGAFALSMGTYEICRTDLKQFLLHDPTFWGNVELTALYLVPLTFLIFAEHLLGPGPLKILRRFRDGNVLFMVYAYGRALVLGDSLWLSLYLFQYYLLIESVLSTLIVAQAAFTGNPEARVFLIGVAFVVLGCVHDVLASLGWLQANYLTNHIGLFFLITSLALIVGRRYFMTVALRKNLELASAVQNLLLPKQLGGTFGPFEFSSYYEPHGRMSGDWLNFWQTRDGGEQRLVFGDVVGKGPRAALAVSAIAAFIENSKESGESLDDLIKRVNSGLSKLFGTHITSTLSAVALHPDGRVDLYNCGGVGWVRLGEAKKEFLPMPSSSLGLEDEPLVARKSLQLAPGEFVFAFTDGVLEGTRGIVKLVRAFRARETSSITFPDVFRITTECGEGEALADDRSIVAVRRPAA